MNSLEKDFINLNKYITNYNKTKLENQFSVKDCIFQTSVIDISNTNNNI